MRSDVTMLSLLKDFRHKYCVNTISKLETERTTLMSKRILLKKQVLYYKDKYKKWFALEVKTTDLSPKLKIQNNPLYNRVKELLTFEDGKVKRNALLKIISYFECANRLHIINKDIKYFSNVHSNHITKDIFHKINSFYHKVMEYLVTGGAYRFPNNMGTLYIKEKEIDGKYLNVLLRNVELKKALNNNMTINEALQKDDNAYNILKRNIILSGFRYAYHKDNKFYDFVLLSRSGAELDYYIEPFEKSKLTNGEPSYLKPFIKRELELNPTLRTNFIRYGKRQYYKHRENNCQDRQ